MHRTISMGFLLFALGALGQQGGDKLSPDQIAKMTRDGTGSVTIITSTPPSADVVLDGRKILRTPAYFVMEKKGDGSRNLAVTLPGYKPYEQKVVVNGQPVALNVKLEKLDSAAPSVATPLGRPGSAPANAAAAASPAQVPPPIELQTHPAGVTPYEYKGIKLGALLTEWQQKNPGDCTSKFTPALVGAEKFNEALSCLNELPEVKVTYGGFLTTSMFVTFYGQRLESISLTFDENVYSDLLHALQEKLGDPTTVERETYQNKFGATFTGAVVTWSNGISQVSLSEVNNDRDHCGLRFLSDELISERAKRAKSKANTKDM